MITLHATVILTVSIAAAFALWGLGGLQGKVITHYNALKERWHKYGQRQIAVWADGRVLIRRGGDPATDEWRRVLSPETLIVHLCREGWTVRDVWKPEWAKDAIEVATKWD